MSLSSITRCIAIRLAMMKFARLWSPMAAQRTIFIACLSCSRSAVWRSAGSAAAGRSDKREASLGRKGVSAHSGDIPDSGTYGIRRLAPLSLTGNPADGCHSRIVLPEFAPRTHGIVPPCRAIPSAPNFSSTARGAPGIPFARIAVRLRRWAIALLLILLCLIIRRI